MYTIIKNVITLGNYVLSDMTNKINTLWITGELTDEQHDELIQLMYQYLNPSTEAPELSERLSRVENRITALEAKLPNRNREPWLSLSGSRGTACPTSTSQVR